MEDITDNFYSYEKWIKMLQPKPEFNLRWYKNADLYSEGDVEDLLIELIAKNAPEDYVDAIRENYSWSTYYHLSRCRRNILNWYPFNEDASVLEIGCGLGAITGLLCDRCSDVTAVELSKRRAAATLLRCREKENLEIIVGNLNDIEFTKKYDYITLIGVLEYQGKYTDTKHPFEDFLCKVKELLKPEGKLLVAIENQYGLKYWCGAREDHTSIPFDGINQYDIGGKTARTFSRKQLEKMIHDSGFSHTFFYYPMPDYKLPTVVYSQECLPENENMQNTRFYYVPDRTTLVAEEAKVYKDVIENGVFEFFANSFLVECSSAADVGKIIFASMQEARCPEYQIATRFWSGREIVDKISLNNDVRHFEQVMQNEQNLKRAGIHVHESRLVEGRLLVEYVDKPLLEEVFVDACRKEDRDKAAWILDMLQEEILKSSEEVNPETNILYELKLAEKDAETHGVILKHGYLDMILRNAVYGREQIEWFDQEWELDALPAKFILYRSLRETYNSFPDIQEHVPLELWQQRYRLQEVWEIYRTLDDVFKSAIIDMTYAKERVVFCDCDSEVCRRNITKLMERQCRQEG